MGPLRLSADERQEVLRITKCASLESSPSHCLPFHHPGSSLCPLSPGPCLSLSFLPPSLPPWAPFSRQKPSALSQMQFRSCYSSVLVLWSLPTKSRIKCKLWMLACKIRSLLAHLLPSFTEFQLPALQSVPRTCQLLPSSGCLFFLLS